MKLHADRPNLNSIQSYGDGWISVNGEKISHSVLLSSTGERADWPCQRFEDLQAAHFNAVLDHQPEVVIFGSGTKLRFVHPSLHAELMTHRVGIETMDTAAACRTFNILSQEGRRVVALLLMEAKLT